MQGLTDPKMIVEDPEFVDAKSRDFHLQPSSPAIDAGVDVGLSFTGSAPDLGAFEFGVSSTAMAANIPSEVNTPPQANTARDVNHETSASSKNTPVAQKRPKSTNERQDLLSFQAFIVGNSVVLNWRMAAESKYSGFQIARGSNKNDFKKNRSGSKF